jgi:hypothetical protein
MNHYLSQSTIVPAGAIEPRTTPADLRDDELLIAATMGYPATDPAYALEVQRRGLYQRFRSMVATL